MHPPHGPHLFKYPRDRLLQLLDVIKKENELRHPKMLDANGEECLLAVKNGIRNSTDVTISRATGIMSFVHEYFEDVTQETFVVMELAIYPYGNKAGAFSTPCDPTDVTYALLALWRAYQGALSRRLPGYDQKDRIETKSQANLNRKYGL